MEIQPHHIEFTFQSAKFEFFIISLVDYVFQHESSQTKHCRFVSSYLVKHSYYSIISRSDTKRGIQ